MWLSRSLQLMLLDSEANLAEAQGLWIRLCSCPTGPSYTRKSSGEGPLKKVGWSRNALFFCFASMLKLKRSKEKMLNIPVVWNDSSWCSQFMILQGFHCEHHTWVGPCSPLPHHTWGLVGVSLGVRGRTARPYYIGITKQGGKDHVGTQVKKEILKNQPMLITFWTSKCWCL